MADKRKLISREYIVDKIYIRLNKKIEKRLIEDAFDVVSEYFQEKLSLAKNIIIPGFGFITYTTSDKWMKEPKYFKRKVIFVSDFAVKNYIKMIHSIKKEK